MNNVCFVVDANDDDDYDGCSCEYYYDDDDDDDDDCCCCCCCVSRKSFQRIALHMKTRAHEYDPDLDPDLDPDPDPDPDPDYSCFQDVSYSHLWYSS
jgi:hypothetical protein